jgi:hypothetical protein
MARVEDKEKSIDTSGSKRRLVIRRSASAGLCSDVSSSSSPAPFVDIGGNELVSREHFKSLSATPFDDMMFVKDNWRIKEIIPADCPSPNAWNYIMEMRNSAEFREEFFTKIFPRIVPSKTQVDDMMSFRDSGQDLKRVIEELADKVSRDSYLSKCGFTYSRADKGVSE